VCLCRVETAKLDTVPNHSFGPTQNYRVNLGDWGRSRSSDGLNVVHINIRRETAVGAVLLRALARNVAGLTALVAGLAGSAEGTAIGRGAVAGDVTELAASVALHGLGLAVTSEVVGTTALVASGYSSARTAIAAAAMSTETTTADRSAGETTSTGWLGATRL